MGGGIGGRSPGFRAFPATPSQPQGGASGCRIGVRRVFARSQWRARAGLSPASLSTDPWIVWRQHSAGRLARSARFCRALGRSTRFLRSDRRTFCMSSDEWLLCVGHALEGTRWESGTDAQRYGQRAKRLCVPESEYSTVDAKHTDPVLANGRLGLHRSRSPGWEMRAFRPLQKEIHPDAYLDLPARAARACVCGLLVPATASATSSKAEIEASVGKGVTYLRGCRKPAAASGTGTSTRLRRRMWPRRTSRRQGRKPTPGRGTQTGRQRNRHEMAQRSAGDRIRARRAGRLRGRDRPGAGLKDAEPDRRDRLLLPARKPRLLRPPGNFNGTVFALLALADAKTTGRRPARTQVLLKKSIERSKKTSTPTAAGPGKRPKATKPSSNRRPNQT